MRAPAGAPVEDVVVRPAVEVALAQPRQQLVGAGRAAQGGEAGGRGRVEPVGPGAAVGVDRHGAERAGRQLVVLVPERDGQPADHVGRLGHRARHERRAGARAGARGRDRDPAELLNEIRSAARVIRSAFSSPPAAV